MAPDSIAETKYYSMMTRTGNITIGEPYYPVCSRDRRISRIKYLITDPVSQFHFLGAGLESSDLMELIHIAGGRI